MQYDWNIVESAVKFHKPNKPTNQLNLGEMENWNILK